MEVITKTAIGIIICDSYRSRAGGKCLLAMRNIVGTHPTPQKYLDMHMSLGPWEDPDCKSLPEPTMVDETFRIAYS